MDCIVKVSSPLMKYVSRRNFERKLQTNASKSNGGVDFRRRRCSIAFFIVIFGFVSPSDFSANSLKSRFVM